MCKRYLILEILKADYNKKLLKNLLDSFIFSKFSTKVELYFAFFMLYQFKDVYLVGEPSLTSKINNIQQIT